VDYSRAGSNEYFHKQFRDPNFSTGYKLHPAGHQPVQL